LDHPISCRRSTPIQWEQRFRRGWPILRLNQGVRQTLAVILCVDPKAAQADWDVNRAYWASFTDDREETAFNQMVIQRCALPRLETAQERTGRIFIQELGRRFGPGLPIPTPQPVTQQHVNCVISAFHNRAAALRGRLTGDALAEANLSPDEHVDIQVALARKGFLQNRLKGYGANADGQFGPNTRSAIKEFQRSIGAQATGFLSNEQRLALAESPEEREGRIAREKSRREAQKRAEELEKQREKERLEDELKKGVEWRQKIDEAQKKGTDYAATVAPDLDWVLRESTNIMTDGGLCCFIKAA
jgi:hypothetical protein